MLASALLLAAVGWFFAATLESILWPRQEIPERVDAVVVLAGGGGERVVFGLAAVELDLADTMIVSESSASAELCAGNETTPETQVICFDASGGTAVEVSQLGAIAEEMGLESLLLVTSDYHMQRAERWLNRCFDGEVFPLAADSTPRKALIRHEVFATAAQVTYQRSCPDPQE